MSATAESRKLRALGEVTKASTKKGDPLAAPNAPYIGLEHIERDLGIINGQGTAVDVRSTKSVFKMGDLLYGKLRPYLNKVWVAQFDGMCSTDILVYPKTDGVENAFLKYRFMASDFVSYANENSNGVNLPRVNAKVLARFPVWLPPPPEQRRIVAEIEKQFTRLDAGVAALRRVQANLKRYRAAVLKAACEGRLVLTEAELAKAEHRKFETGEELLARILKGRRKNWTGRGGFVEPINLSAAARPKLPEGWVWATVEQLSIVVRGASPRPAGDPRYFGGDVPWITVGPLTADNNPYLNSVSASLNELGRGHSRYIEAHTLLLTNSGATLGVPKISLIGGCINDGVAALFDVDYPLKLYLLYFLRTQTERLRGLNQGAAQPNLNTTIIKSIHVPLPPLAEQTRIVAEVERRLSVVEELEIAVSVNLQRSARVRQSVLAKAFSGRLGTL